MILIDVQVMWKERRRKEKKRGVGGWGGGWWGGGWGLKRTTVELTVTLTDYSIFNNEPDITVTISVTCITGEHLCKFCQMFE